MVQFYFLAVLMNILCGLILVYGEDSELDSDNLDDGLENDGISGGNSIPGLKKIQDGIAGESLFANELFRLVCGALCLVVGIVTLFVPYSGPAVLGDMLPSLCALFAGASVLLAYFEERSEEFVAPEICDTILISNKLYIGIAALLFGVIHFIIPGAPLF